MMLRYLALGDSYTIGEQLGQEQNFPTQLAGILRSKYFWEVADPEIIAKTGWTAKELMAGIREQKPPYNFDLVSLLVGVNDQYRGLSADDYEHDFLQLVLKAILFAGGRADRVFVLSIPDWGITPFAQAEGRDPATVANEIDLFNKKNRAIALVNRCHYLNITDSSRDHGRSDAYLTPDGLHYSEQAYQVWAEALAAQMAEALR